MNTPVGGVVGVVRVAVGARDAYDKLDRREGQERIQVQAGSNRDLLVVGYMF